MSTYFTTGNLNTVGRLLNSTGTELASDDSYLNFLIRDRLDSGTYYIQVRSFSTGDYILHVDAVTTTKIELNTSASGTIDSTSDVDYFSLDISTPTFVVIFTTGNLNMVGRLRDSEGNVLQLDFNSGAESNFLIRDRLDPGTYYIQVGSFGTGDYVIHVVVVGVGVDDHSDTIAMATELTLNTSVSGTIDSASDVDYFSLDISTPTFVAIFTTGNLNTLGTLYDGTNNFLQNDNSSGVDGNFLIRDRLNPGTYYIQVGSFGTGNYVLHVDVVTTTEIELNTSVSGTIDPRK